MNMITDAAASIGTLRGAQPSAADSRAYDRAVQQHRIDCKVRALEHIDLPSDDLDAAARFRALPAHASMVYWRGNVAQRWCARDFPFHYQAGPIGNLFLRLEREGKCHLVQRRVGAVEEGVCDYVAVKRP